MRRRDSVSRPWTKAEQVDYQRFLAELDQPITDEVAEFLAPDSDLVYEAPELANQTPITERQTQWLLIPLRKVPVQAFRK